MTGSNGKDFRPLRQETEGRSVTDPAGFPGPGYARRWWGEAKAGAEHFQSARSQLPKGRIRQFFYGAALPFHIARATLAQSDLRRRYIRVTALQTAFLLAMAGVWAAYTFDEDGARKTRWEKSPEGRALRKEAQERIEKHALSLQDALKQKDAAGKQDSAAVRQALQGLIAEAVRAEHSGAVDAEEAQHITREAAEQASKNAASLPAEEARAPAPLPSDDAKAARDDAKTARDDAKAAHEDAKTARDDAKAAHEDAKTARDDTRPTAADEADEAEATDDTDEAGATEDHASAADDTDEAEAAEDRAEARADAAEAAADNLGNVISAALTAAFEDTSGETGSAGLRIRKEAQQKGFNIDAPQLRRGIFFLGSWEFWVLFFGSLSAVQWIIVALSRDYHCQFSREASLTVGVPPEDPDVPPRVRLNVPWIKAKIRRRWRAFGLFMLGFPGAAMLSAPLCWVPYVFTTLTSAWGFWWLIVFTAAKSDRAWVAPVTRPPWFVLAWTALPFLRWGMFRWYGATLHRRSEQINAPIASVERQPWAFAGLALTRFVGSIPPLRCFTRPFIPVASSHLLSLDPQQPPAGVRPPDHTAGD